MSDPSHKPNRYDVVFKKGGPGVEVDTPRPPTDEEIRQRLAHRRYTPEVIPGPGDRLDRLHALALLEAEKQRPNRKGRPLGVVLSNLALILDARGDADGAARVRAELEALG